MLVGRVVRAHGVKGELLVEALSERSERFADASRLLVSRPDRQGHPFRTVEVQGARRHKGLMLVRFVGVADRDEAESLRGCWLEIDRSEVPPPPEGSYWFFELVGCRCVDRVEGDLGTVVEVFEDGGGLLLEVEGDGRRLLIPFVQAFLIEVDVAAGRIEVELPEGLVDVCVST